MAKKQTMILNNEGVSILHADNPAADAVSIHFHTQNATATTIDAFGTASFVCSADVTLGGQITSAIINSLSVGGTQNVVYTVTTTPTLPVTITNGTEADQLSSVLMTVGINNSSPAADGSIIVSNNALTLGLTTIGLSGGSTVASLASSSDTISLSGEGGWRGSSTGRIWPTHKEHIRLRNLGYI